MFHREVITCRTDTVPPVGGSPGGLELLIRDIIVIGTPRGDEYRATLDDVNVAGDKGLPGVMVTQAGASVRQLLPPVNQNWSKFAPSLGNCFCVSPPIVPHDDV